MLARESLLEELADGHRKHSPASHWWQEKNEELQQELTLLDRCLKEQDTLILGHLGELQVPQVDMGFVSTKNLFELNELILFAYYHRSASRYSRVTDCGANIGVHSMVLAKLGYFVDAYEPDPLHYTILEKNLVGNDLLARVSPHQAAVTVENGIYDFVRILNNTTASCLTMSTKIPYGPSEMIRVVGVSIVEAIQESDLVKLDVEGVETFLIAAITVQGDFRGDILAEVGSAKNAGVLWELLRDSEWSIFTQKYNWRRAQSFHQLPTSHREGSVFITRRGAMPWG